MLNYSSENLPLCTMLLFLLHCNVIIGRNPIEANANTGAIQTTGKFCSLYQELLHPILGIPLASIGKLPFLGKLPIEV